MAIGQSKLHELLRRRLLLSEALTWIKAFDPVNKRIILDLVREDQLRRKGIDGDGKVIGYYSLTTSFINPLKKFNTHYTLYDTGEFFKSMYIRVLADRIEIEADSNKGDEDLFIKYGNEIVKLTDENKELVAEIIRKEYRKIVRKTLFGN